MSNQLDATIAKRLDITVKENQTFDALLTFTDDADAPINLLGVSMKLSVREDGCNTSCACIGDNNFNQVFKQDFVPTTYADGQVQFNDIIKLAPGSYKYDLLAEFPDDARRYLLTGTFKVKRSFTQISI